jgi:uncharacterized protein
VADTPSRILIDTGPLVALFDAGDSYHARGLEFVKNARAQLLSTMAVVTEAMYVLDDSLAARKNLLTWIHVGGLMLLEPQGHDFERIAELLDKYADVPMDFTDAVIVALAERLGVHHVTTIDRDFRIYRCKGRTKFVNVFAD